MGVTGNVADATPNVVCQGGSIPRVVLLKVRRNLAYWFRELGLGFRVKGLGLRV